MSSNPKLDRLLERDVVKQVKDFLEYRGWRLFRTHFAFAPGAFSTAEPGCPDWIALRYAANGQALLFWLEAKGPGDRRKCSCTVGKQCKVCRQKAWHARERARGAIVIVVSELEQFELWYEKQFGYLHRDPDRAVGQLRMEGI